MPRHNYDLGPTNQRFNHARKSDRTSRILLALSKAPEGLTTHEIAAALGEDRSLAIKSMSTLTGSRRAIVSGLRRMEEGPKGRKPIYHITHLGREALAALPA